MISESSLYGNNDRKRSSIKHINKNVPKLRFPGFEGEWEETFLSELLEFQNGINAESEKYGKGIKYISVMDILNNDYITYSNIRGLVDIDDSTLQRYSVKYGDILFQRSSETKEDIGNTNVYLDRERTATFGGFVIRGKKIGDYDPFFLKCLLCCPSSRKKLVRMGAGSQHYNIGQENLSKIQIRLPDLSEQQKISHLMMLLNKRIAKQRELINIIKTYKRGALSVMFPQKGETVPRCRFSSFTGDWKLHKFSDFTWDSGKRNKDNLDLEPYAITNEYGFIRQSEAHDDFGYMKDTDRKAYNIVKPKSFAYNPARINVGSIGYYEGTEDVIVSSLYEVFQTADYVDDRFLWHWFKSEEFPKYIEKLQEGSVRLYFYYDKLCECQLLMPSLPEQKKIATILDEFDNYITLHQNKLDMLMKTKQSLLQQLFI